MHLLSTFSDLFQTLSIQSRQPDLVAVLRKFQNVPYNAPDIFVKDLSKCSNAFAKLKRYVPSSSPVFHFLHFLNERRMKNNVDKHLANIKKKRDRNAKESEAPLFRVVSVWLACFHTSIELPYAGASANSAKLVEDKDII